jgi:hypothetical protein
MNLNQLRQRGAFLFWKRLYICCMPDTNIKVKLKGVILTPHLYRDGRYVASESRFNADYQYVKEVRELIPHILEGLSIRMSSNLKRNHPRLISAEIILIQNPHLEPTKSQKQ